MRKIRFYIFSLLYLGFIIILISLAKNYESEYRIENLVITNNKIIPTTLLLEFAKISDKESLTELKAEVIIDRIEKHPFVKEAEGFFVDSTTLKIKVEEFNPFVRLITKNGNYVFTKEKRIIPDTLGLQIYDLPVVTFDKTITEIYQMKNDRSLLELVYQAFYNIYETDRALFEILSEINLNNDNDLVIYLSNPKGKIIVGKILDKRIAVYLSGFWREVILKNKNLDYEYIDLRFSDQIIVKELKPRLS